jgi:hypothetical protein
VLEARHRLPSRQITPSGSLPVLLAYRQSFAHPQFGTIERIAAMYDDGGGWFSVNHPSTVSRNSTGNAIAAGCSITARKIATTSTCFTSSNAIACS